MARISKAVQCFMYCPVFHMLAKAAMIARDSKYSKIYCGFSKMVRASKMGLVFQDGRDCQGWSGIPMFDRIFPNGQRFQDWPGFLRLASASKIDLCSK